MQMIGASGKMSVSRWVWLWTPVIVYCVLIFTLSAQKDLSPPQFPSSDKVAHFVVYAGLGILWARAAQATWPRWTFQLLLLSSLLFTGLYGVTDEWHQLYVPGRFSDWRDAVADVCGGTVGGMVYLAGSRFLSKRAAVSPTPVA
ncbi:MAG: VanZ family protein [Deltaproteobacteria bacterium]|nr:VanZ family protein [Deltaproteobacteria bacterium]